jgi:hypothetical protein
VESFLPEPVTVKIISDQSVSAIEDLLSGESLEGAIVPLPPFMARSVERTKSFDVTIKPHSYKVFRTRIAN